MKINIATPALALAMSFALTGCSLLGGASDLSVTKMPSNQGQWGTYCESVMGQGWSCLVEVKVENKSTKPWSGNLTANLISDSGSVSVGQDDPNTPTLKGEFNENVNPGELWDWTINFPVGENQKFKEVQIKDGGMTISTIPVCLGSSDQYSEGC